MTVDELASTEGLSVTQSSPTSPSDTLQVWSGLDPVGTLRRRGDRVLVDYTGRPGLTTRKVTSARQLRNCFRSMRSRGPERHRRH